MSMFPEQPREQPGDHKGPEPLESLRFRRDAEQIEALTFPEVIEPESKPSREQQKVAQSTIAELYRDCSPTVGRTWTPQGALAVSVRFSRVPEQITLKQLQERMAANQLAEGVPVIYGVQYLAASQNELES